MDCRHLDITLISAENLPNVREFGQMKVYAQVSINGIEKTKKTTPVDMENECNPVWNISFRYTIGELSVQKASCVDLQIKLFCKRTFGDRYISEVTLPLRSLFENGPNVQNIGYAVGGGILNISYNFGQKIVVQKPSGWDKAISVITAIGITILVKGTILLITGGASDGGFDIPIFTDPSDVIIDLDSDAVTVDDEVIVDV